MTPPRSGRLLRLALLAAPLLGCTAREPAAASRRPSAEFLLSAGDSTFWVASDSTRVRVRASPMFVARYGGRTYEVYAADDDRSYYDAVFTSQRIYRRDLVAGDSLSVYADALVPALARRYAAAHPHEAPLGPDDEAASRPHTSAIAEVSLVDVHGPYLTYDAFADVDDEDDVSHTQHSARRVVVDLRSAAPASLGALFGAVAADSLAAEGRRALGRALDSVRAVADPDDEAAVRAVHAIPSFRFLADNFGLATAGTRPAVTFVAIGRDVDGAPVTLPLPPIAVPGEPPAWWRAEVERALPTVSRDSSDSRWSLPATDVVARRLGTQATASLLLRARGGRGDELSVAHVPTPVRQLYALDRPPLDAAARRALARAFDESARYGGTAVAAAYHRRPALSHHR